MRLHLKPSAFSNFKTYIFNFYIYYFVSQQKKHTQIKRDQHRIYTEKNKTFAFHIV